MSTHSPSVNGSVLTDADRLNALFTLFGGHFAFSPFFKIQEFMKDGRRGIDKLIAQTPSLLGSKAQNYGEEQTKQQPYQEDFCQKCGGRNEVKLRRLAVSGRAMLTALRNGPVAYEQSVAREYNDLLAAVMEADLTH